MSDDASQRPKRRDPDFALPARKRRRRACDVTERALVVWTRDAPIVDERTLLRTLKAAFRNENYAQLLALLLQYRESRWLRATAVFTILFGNMAAIQRVEAAGDEQLRVLHEIVELLLWCVRYRRRYRLNRPAFQLVMFLRSAALQELLVETLLAVDAGGDEVQTLMKEFLAYDSFKLFATLLARTDYSIHFTPEICPQPAQGDGVHPMAVLVERAMVRRRFPWYILRRADHLGVNLLRHIHQRFTDARFYQLLIGWHGETLPELVTTLRVPFNLGWTERLHILRRLNHHRYFQMAVPLLQWGLSYYHVVWLLEWLFPEDAITHAASLEIVIRVHEARRLQALAKTPRANELARLD
jgi:hypothetical protein